MNVVTQDRDLPKDAPKYAVVRDWLARRIHAGDLAPGARLPSEHSLVRKFGVSRVTVRHALDSLKNSGMVESHQGQGHFVRGVKADLDLRRLQGLGEALVSGDVAASARLLGRAKVRAGKRVRQALDLEPAAAVTVVSRLRLADALPICHEERFFPEDVARSLTDRDLESEDVTGRLEQNRGVAIAFGDVIMDMVAAPPRIARLLDLEPGTTVVRTEQVNFDVTGRPIDVCIRHAVAGAFRYRTRVGR